MPRLRERIWGLKVTQEETFSAELLQRIVDGIIEIERRKIHQVNPQLVHDDILKLVREEIK